jgi:hypothetical protein
LLAFDIEKAMPLTSPGFAADCEALSPILNRRSFEHPAVVAAPTPCTSARSIPSRL